MTASIICFHSYAQIINKDLYIPADENMILNVKQFSQFVKRFNYEEDFSGNKISPEFTAKFPRNAYMAYLFNIQDERLNNDSPEDQKYQSKVHEFVLQVSNKNEHISRYSEKIYVVALCEIQYKSIKKELHLLLQQEKVNDGLKWVICDVLNMEDIVKTEPSSPNVFIPPSSNELNFTHLRRAFDDKQNFSDYYSRDFQLNPLHVLEQEVKSGSIEFQHVKKMVYFVFDIEGWVIQIEEFIRDDMNSGWLISNLEKWNTDPNVYFERK